MYCINKKADMKELFCLIIGIFCALISEKQVVSLKLNIDPEKLRLIDALVKDQFMPLHNIPGLALVINDASTNETIIRNYGLRDKEDLIPVTSNTRFLIASISKSFTATIACKILSEHFPQFGESVLDIPIVKLAPNYNLTLSDRYRTESVTFRDLLSHKTCLASYGLGTTAGAYPNKQNRIYRYRYLQEKCSFRSKFVYSNAMITLSGELIAHIAGTPFNQLVMDFFQSLGMNDSLIVNETEDYETLPNMSRGYLKNPDGLLEKMPARIYNGNSGAASGGIISTPEDMGKYLSFHLNNGRVGNQQIVPENVLKWARNPSHFLQMSSSKNVATNIYDTDFAYGLGFFLELYNGWFRIGHDGDLSPFTSRLSFYPELKIGFFTIINGPGLLPVDTDQRILQNHIFEILQGNAKENTYVKAVSRLTDSNGLSNKKSVSSSQSLFKKNYTIDLQTLAGVYGHPYEGDFTLLYNDSIPDLPLLQIQYGLWGSGYLQEIPENPGLFIIDWFGDIVKLFYAYSGGQPVGEMKLDCRNVDTCIYIDSDGEINYKRNATLETYPQIPWSNDSCGPEY